MSKSFNVTVVSEVSPLRTTGTIVIDDRSYDWTATKGGEGIWNPVLMGASLLTLQEPEVVETAKSVIRGTLYARETLERIKSR